MNEAERDHQSYNNYLDRIELHTRIAGEPPVGTPLVDLMRTKYRHPYSFDQKHIDNHGKPSLSGLTGAQTTDTALSKPSHYLAPRKKNKVKSKSIKAIAPESGFKKFVKRTLIVSAAFWFIEPHIDDQRRVSRAFICAPVSGVMSCLSGIDIKEWNFNKDAKTNIKEYKGDPKEGFSAAFLGVKVSFRYFFQTMDGVPMHYAKQAYAFGAGAYNMILGPETGSSTDVKDDPSTLEERVDANSSIKINNFTVFEKKASTLPRVIPKKKKVRVAPRNVATTKVKKMDYEQAVEQALRKWRRSVAEYNTPLIEAASSTTRQANAIPRVTPKKKKVRVTPRNGATTKVEVKNYQPTRSLITNAPLNVAKTFG